MVHSSPPPLPPSASQSSLSRYHPQHMRLRSPPVPRLRISMMGDELLLLTGTRGSSNRTSVAGSVTASAAVLNSARSGGSRDENDVPVYRHRLSQQQVALSVGDTPQRTPRGAGVRARIWKWLMARMALGSCLSKLV